MLKKAIKTRHIFNYVLRYSVLKNLHFKSAPVCLCSTSVSHGNEKNIEDLFLNPEVQGILKRITGRDYDKIFAVSQRPLEPHKYEFATEERLKELQNWASSEADKKLQMPPVMSIRKPIEEVLSKDPELQGYLKHKVVFTDISPNVPSRYRQITVRETDGTLRKASWEERDRMNQIFYPMPGRHLDIPMLFQSPNFESLLDERSYKFVLDCACCQFEPDDSEYHRITTATYDHIETTKSFDNLRSTRHFGPMSFYYALTKRIDHLLIDMIERQLMNDAFDVIKLLYHIHSDLNSSKKVDENNKIEVIEDYITNNATLKSNLELALQTFFEMSSTINKEASALNQSSN